MSLANLPSLFVVPPLNCLAAACLGAVWRRRRVGRYLLGWGLGGLWVLSLPLVSGNLLVALERGLPTQAPAGHKPGAIVILSGDEAEVEQDGARRFTVGLLTLERERAGAALARLTGLPILVSGGQIQVGSPSLAALMDASLRADFGVVTKWQEGRSLDTWENAAFSAAILRAAGIDEVYVVSNAWHLRRAMIAFRAAGLRAVAAPADPQWAPRLDWSGVLPRVSAWQESYFALHEWIGCAWYALRA